MKKGGFLRTVFDGLRSNQPGTQSGQGYSGSGSNQNKGLIDQYEGLLKSNHFALSTVVRHGFPAQPTAIAFDPVQRIVAIGTKSGSLRIFGRPSVDVHGQHKPEYAVLYIKFVVNQGAVITVTADDSIHLWSLRGPNLVLQLSTTSTNTSPLPPLSGVVGTSSSSSNASGSNHQSTTTSASAHHHQATMGANCVGGGGNSQSSGGGGGGLEGGTFQSNSAKLNQTSKLPEILHTLKFQREHITYVHLTLQSKWLYIGTERGNVHIMNVETFELSGYVINWNKAIELSRKTHPGSIKHISECPQDTNKLLIGYESGYIVLWDLKTRAAEGRYYNLDNLQWLCWHFEGKQFTAAHGDGSLITWNTRSNAHPAHKSHPHAKTGGSSSSTGQQQQGDDQQAAMPPFRAINTELYRPINKVDWKTSRNNEQIVLFSGGLPYDNMPPTTTNTTLSSAAPSPQPQAHSPYNQQQLAPSLGPAGTSLSPSSPSPSPTPIDMRSPARNSSALASHQQQQQQQASASNSSSSSSSSHDKNLNSTSLTVMYGRSLTVLEMDDTIVDFITICDNSPYENDASEPFAVIILLVNDLILIDLNSPGYPSFQSPNPININASPVTSIHYLADCPSDLIPSLYSTSNNSVMTGQQRNRKGFSDKEWPIDGGEWGQSMQSYPELVITGHADGSVQFWDMSCVNFDPISKIKTSKLFDKPNRLQNNPNLIISGGGCGLNGSAIATSRYSPSPFGSSKSPVPPSSNLQSSQQQQQQIDSSTSSPPGNNDSASINQLTSQQQQQQQINNNEDYYAIEQIEFCPSTKHLLVAGACSQVIQFKLNRKEVQSELTTVIVEPTSSMSFNSSYEPMTGFGVSSLLPNQHANSNHKQHFILRPKSGHHRRTTGFQPELLCVTPWIISTANCGPEAQTMTYCQSPYRITSLALHTTHNLLAYSHDNGIVIIDVIQKCVVINSSTSELYGPMGMSHFGGGNRDIISSGVKCGAGNAGQMMGKSPKRMSGTAPANMAESNNPGQDNHSQADLFGQQQSRKSPSLDQQRNDDAKTHNCQQTNNKQAGNSEQQTLVTTLDEPVVTATRDSPSGLLSSSAPLAAAAAVAPTGLEGPVAPPRFKRRSIQIACGEAELLSSHLRPLSAQLSNIDEQQNPEPNSDSGNSEVVEQVKLTAAAANRKTAGRHRTFAGKLVSKLDWSASIALDQLSQDYCSGGGVTSSAAASAPAPAPAKMKKDEADVETQTERQDYRIVATDSSKCDVAQSGSSQQVLDSCCAATNTLGDNATRQGRRASGGGSNIRHTNNIAAKASSSQIHSQQQQQDTEVLVGAGVGVPLRNPLRVSPSCPIGQMAAAYTTNTNQMINYDDTCIADQQHQQHQQHLLVDKDSLEDQLNQKQIDSVVAGRSSQQILIDENGSNNNNNNNRLDSRVPITGDANKLASRTNLDETMPITSSKAAGLLQMGQPVSKLGVPLKAESSTMANMYTMFLNRFLDKIDASFTRSRSSSCSSTTDQVQNNSIESIQCIHFVDNHLGKSEATQLWMGTSHGAVLLIAITMPDSDDNRVLQLQSVIAVPTITNIKLSGSILCLYQLQMDLHNSNSNLGGHNGGQSGGHLHHLPSSSSTEEASTSGQINAATTTGVGASTTTAGAATTSGSGSSSLLNKQDSSSFDLPTTGGSGGSGGSGSGHHHHLGSSSSSNSGASSGGVVHHYHKAEQQQQQQQQQRPSIMVIVSEKHARVYQLPLSASLLIDTNSGHCVTNQSTATTTTNRCLAAEQQQLDKDKQHNCLAKIKLTETSFACKSSIVSMKQPDESCLVTYLATGNILIHSLPKLKLLLDVDFVPLCNVRIATTLCFSRNGHGLYLSSASELTKFTINAAYKAMVNDMIGSVYVPKDMPEMPRPNFFKALSSSLFSTSGKSSDRDELFSETSAGKASRGVARHIPVAGSSGMDKLNRAAVGTVGHELRMAREGLDERGEKLSELEDKTLQMMNQAESYGQSASQLVAKFKDKKWYQF